MNKHNTVRQMNKLRDAIMDKANIVINPAHITHIEHAGLMSYPLDWEYDYDKKDWFHIETKKYELFGICFWRKTIQKDRVTKEEYETYPYHLIRVYMSDGSFIRIYRLTFEQALNFMQEFDDYVNETLDLMDDCVEESREEETSENYYPGVSG